MDETQKAPEQKPQRKPLRRKPRAKRTPKKMDDQTKQATAAVSGIFTKEMMAAGATTVRMKELDVKRHGATGFAEWPDKTRITLTITSKG